MGQLHGILFWVFGLILIINSELTLAQHKRSSSRITSSRSFGTNIKGSSSSSSSSSATGVNFDCPEEFGYYPHPNDCTQYYVCVFGGALLESCTGGLMYSHELQTCDWPRNVGCDIIDGGGASLSVPSSGGGGGSSSYRDVTPRVPQIKQQPQQSYQQQQQQQQINHRDRFGPTYSSSTPSIQSKPTIVQQYQPRQQQQQQHQRVIQAQVQTLPPPPELRVAPNPVITSRGQPKPLLDSHEDIAKLYADAHDTLPPVEEEESDRQQRVYRGQPSTVGQVQRDRDGIIHQASINAIPNHGKIGSFAYGAQINQYRLDQDVDNSIDDDVQQRPRRRRREVQNVTAVDSSETPSKYTNQTTPSTVIAEDSTLTVTEDNTDSTDDTNDDYDSVTPSDYIIDDSDTDESVRSTRQLRPQFNSRLNRWQLSSSNYRAVDSNPYQQQSFSFGAFNPYLAPPLNPHLKGIKPNPLDYKPKSPYSYSISGTTQSPLEAYKPFYQPPTSRPSSLFQQPDVLPFLLQSLKEIQQQKKKKQEEADNFSYFHLGTDPVRPVTPSSKPIPSSHYSQFSTVGGFFNNFDNQQSYNFNPTSGHHHQPKVVSQFSIASPDIEVSTESNYFEYNILQNQKMKSYYSTTTTAFPPTSNFKIVSPPNLSSGTPTNYQSPTSNTQSSVQTHQFHFVNLTTTPYPIYSKPASISSNYNLGDLMSNIKASDMEHMQPALMNMFKYFKQTTGPAGHREKVTQSPLHVTTENEEYEYYDEEEDLRTKKPTPTTKAPKGYESFIKSIPSQSYKTQTKFTLKNIKPTTPKTLPDDYYYDEEEDDYRIRHPPSEKPVYMPNSETMPPRPVMNSTLRYKSPNSVTGFYDVTTRRPVFSSHFQNNDGIPSFINFPSDIFQDLRMQHHVVPTTTDRPITTTTSPTTTSTKAAITTTTTRRPYTSTTTRKIYTVRPNRGHNKWKYNKASEATKTERRKQRPQTVVVTQRPPQLNKEVVNIDSNR
ncbi:mucin-2 isoform X4 [Episyrphus balteatus]|uniref:mucin-2 isoform X4 n=1 Tax=Episyrphus balteatus TaxID=286459 RepID=UPI00248600B6|nr:mucin-2 isoform X4 [Episyrphus balteatus]